MKDKLITHGIFLSVVIMLLLMPSAKAWAYAEKPSSVDQLVPEMKDGNVSKANVVSFSGLKWYVIGYDGTGAVSAKGTITLFASSCILELGPCPFDYTSRADRYSSSDLRRYLDKYTDDSFTDLEKAAIRGVTLEGGGKSGSSNDKIAGVSVDNAKLWPLSAAEAAMLSKDILTDYSFAWWLRTPRKYGIAVCPRASGEVDNDDHYSMVENSNGVRPALQLSLDKIKFNPNTQSLSAEKAVVKTPPLAIQTLIYNGHPQKLITPGVAEGGTIEYSFIDTIRSQDYGEWSTEIPVGTDLGQYIVRYRVIGDDDHLDDGPFAVIYAGIKRGGSNVYEISSSNSTAAAAGTVSYADSVSYNPLEQEILQLDEYEEPSGAVFHTLRPVQYSANKKSVTVGWNKVDGAVSYHVYFSEKGKPYQKLAAQKETAFTHNNLQAGKTYKYIVAAYDASGKHLTVSRPVYVMTGKKNAKSVSLNYTKLKLEPGDSVKLKASVKGGGIHDGLGIRYESTDQNVAVVSKNGRITAAGSGKCLIIAFAHNGIHSSCRITVK